MDDSATQWWARPEILIRVVGLLIGIATLAILFWRIRIMHRSLKVQGQHIETLQRQYAMLRERNDLDIIVQIAELASSEPNRLVQLLRIGFGRICNIAEENPQDSLDLLRVFLAALAYPKVKLTETRFRELMSDQLEHVIANRHPTLRTGEQRNWFTGEHDPKGETWCKIAESIVKGEAD